MSRLTVNMVLGLALVALMSCQGQPVRQGPMRIAAVYVPGGLGGYPYNDTIHEAIKKAKTDLGIEFDNNLTNKDTDVAVLLRTLARDKKYDAIVIIGFQNTKAMIQIGKEFPDQKFIGVEAGTDQEGTPHNLPNVASYTANYYQPMYTAGALAAMMTKTGIIGSVWSMDVKKYGSYVRAYTDGANSVHPKVKVLAEYTGSYQEKPPKGKECAEKLIAQGADILMNHTQAERTGVIEAVKEKGAVLIGFGHESKLAPQNTLFDLNRHSNEDVYRAIKAITEGKFKAGTFYQGLVENHYTLDFTQPRHPRITPEVQKKTEEIIRKFASGELKKPWTAEIPEMK